MGSSLALANLHADPPVPSVLLNPSGSVLPATNTATASVAEPATTPGGAVQATLTTAAVQAGGSLVATWSSTTASAFSVQSLTATRATIKDSSGHTVGSGTAALSLSQPIAAVITGHDQFSASGSGTLAFYGPAEASLGVSGNWSSYTANVTGAVVITITTSGLTLDSQSLPAGTYTISTSSASLSGSGSSTSPEFTGAVSISASGATINLGPGSGSVSAGGKPLDPDDTTTLDAYHGTVNVNAGGSGTDSVSLNGTAGNVLQAAAAPTTITTDQNTPVTVATNLAASLADTYSITANAPAGWSVTVDGKGNVTATPAPGTQSGTFPIQIIAQSQSDASLVAQTTLLVTVGPTQAGMKLAVAADSEFTVPVSGAQLPSAFQASIQNLGPTADTYDLTFSNVPSGFSVQSSNSSVTIPAGQTGIVGVYLVPNAGQALPAPGTQLSFSITATSTTTSTITKTQTKSFTVPAIDAVSITASPTSVNTTPGVAATDTLSITNAGNVAENNIVLGSVSSSGLTVSGLATLSLAVGQSATETVSFTPSASTPLNSILQSTITATYGPSASQESQSLNMVVDVVVPGATAIANAALAAQQLGNAGLVGRLQDLSTALTSLVQDPTSAACTRDRPWPTWPAW